MCYARYGRLQVATLHYIANQCCLMKMNAAFLQMLNAPQLKAVQHPPTANSCRARERETKVLTSRIAPLIPHHHLPASSICAVTFTNKAANEMRDRLEKLLGKERTNKVRIPKTLQTAHPPGPTPVLRTFQQEAQESAFIAIEIKRLVAASGSMLGWSDFVVLLRFNTLSRSIESALQWEGILSRVLGGYFSLRVPPLSFFFILLCLLSILLSLSAFPIVLVC
ncbi:hypothetical protein FIBSPDRAFT_1041707 [Athelia psychrophila]|uniref:UvrD-like helicase ATP-binding domain-containing protein n=1 Tax=Athelia psychrophila TaxID=1759441 RepID=A0A166NPP7_9AGAM|nr:hypothetical protein FIBSPDRAFT_1041707 [Fibularhizoctonia sp. CBS 109695]